MTEEVLYQIALKKLEGVGPQRARLLVSYCGGLSQLFAASKRDLAAIPQMGKAVLAKLNRDQALKSAEEELKFILKKGLKTLFYLDDSYPHRLKHCEDAPVLLYAKGDMELNAARVVSIVGTRSCTSYGERVTERLIEGLVPYGALVTSGLAYGIDTLAHRCAVKSGLQTVGVVGHSLDRLYPSSNESLVQQMLTNGGILSEFESGTKPDRENFPQRNRIVAGMADVTVVVETKVKGGSMITARLAAGYNRDVAAFPGPADAPFSGGCNHLIKTSTAALIEGIEDLAKLMSWEKQGAKRTIQQQLFVELTEVERHLVTLLQKQEKTSLDNLSIASELPVSKTATALLSLEFKGVVRSLPGKMYAIA